MLEFLFVDDRKNSTSYKDFCSHKTIKLLQKKNKAISTLISNIEVLIFRNTLIRIVDVLKAGRKSKH